MLTPVRAVTASPFATFATGLPSAFQVEYSCTSSVAVQAPNWQPSNGQAFSSICGSSGLGALCGVSEGSSCGAASRTSKAISLNMGKPYQRTGTPVTFHRCGHVGFGIGIGVEAQPSAEVAGRAASVILKQRWLTNAR